MLTQAGFETGIDVGRLRRAVAIAEELTGQTLGAGSRPSSTRSRSARLQVRALSDGIESYPVAARTAERIPHLTPALSAPRGGEGDSAIGVSVPLRPLGGGGQGRWGHRAAVISQDRKSL